MAQFDSLFADEDAKAKAPVAPPSTPTAQPNYDALFTDSDQLSNSLFTAQGTNPDAEAKKQKLSKELGIPAGILPQDAETQAAAKRIDTDQVTTGSPATAKFLTNSDNAKVTGLDGVKGLQAIEKVQKEYTPEAIQTFIKEYTATGKSAAEASQALTKLRNEGVSLADYNHKKAGRDWAEVLPDFGKSVAGGVNSMLAGATEAMRYLPGTRLQNALIRAITGRDAIAEQQEMLNANQEYWQAEKSPEMRAQIEKFNKADTIESVGMLIYTPSLLADQLGQSLPYLVPGGAAARGGEAAALAYTTLQEAMDAANTARQEAIANGATLDQQNRSAAVAAIITAPIAFLGNKLAGTGLLESKFFTKGTTGHNLLSTMLREAFSGAMEEGGNTFGVNLGASSTHDPMRDVWQNVAKSAAVGGFLESVHGGAMISASSALRLALGDVDRAVGKNSEAHVEASKAEAVYATMQGLTEQAAENALLKRSPEAFHEFVSTMSENGNLSEVHVTANTLNTVLASAGVTTQNLQSTMPELAAQLNEALSVNGEVNTVSIPVADYLTHFVNTPVAEALLPELRATPEGATYKDSQDFYQTQQEQFLQQVEGIAKENTPLMSREEFAQAKVVEQAVQEILPPTAREQEQNTNTPSAPIQGSATSEGNLPATYEQYVAEHSNKAAAYAADVKSVADNINGQFKSTGRFTPSVTSAYTAPLVEFYKTQAKSFNTTPSKMYAKYPFKVQSFLSGTAAQNLSQGAVATLDDFRAENVKDILTKSNWTILTAENPGAAELSPEENATRMAELTSQLDAEGMAYYLTDGQYGRKEKSLILFNSTPEQALALGRQFDQESVLTRDGYIYQDGTRTPTTGEVTVHATPPEDYYTTVTFPDGTVSMFTIGLDFETRLQQGEVYIPLEQIGAGEPSTEVNQGGKLGQVSITGVHFSNTQRPTLSGQYFGTGIKGQEGDRVRRSKDSRIRNRLYFYVDEGKGVFPEYGVGSFKHVVKLDNMYDGYRNPQKFPTRDANGERDLNLFESAVIEAGFDGYYIQDAFGRQGAAIMLGDASKNVKPIGELKQSAADVSKALEAKLVNHDEAVAEYATRPDSMNGKILNTDVARELSPDYLANRSLAAAVHEVSSAFIKKLYKQKLAEAPTAGELPIVLFTAGGTGAGKTSALLQADADVLADKQIIYDTNMATYDSSEEKVEQALRAGKVVDIRLTIRDPIDGLINGALPRAMRQAQEFGTGRPVPIKNHASTYLGAPVVVQQLAEKYKGNPLVSFKVYDNSFGKGNAIEISVADANKYVYNSQQELEDALLTALKGEYEKGKISEAVARATAHTSRGNEENRVITEKTGQGISQGSKQSGELNQSVSLRDGRETLKKYGLDPNKTHMTRDIAAALEARQRAKYGSIAADDRSPEAIKKIANWMAEEVGFEMQNPSSSGVGWYSEKFQRALDTMAKEFPELATDKAARDTMTSLIAITSDGQKVFGNFAQAMDIYGTFKKTGKFTTLRGHHRTASIVGNLQNLQRLYDKMGAETMHGYLMQEKTVSELKKIAKANGAELATPYQAHIKMPMAAVEFGPKLGAFYANLMGAHGYLTMDRWWSRSFNRYRGTLLTKPTQVGLTRFKELMGNPEMSNDEAIAAVVIPAGDYAAKGFKNGTEIEKAANTIYKAAFIETEDIPFNASDRTFMLDAVEKARQVLKRRGYDLSIADIQAILWYYEKRLYGDLGARQSADISYEEAAARVVSDRAGARDGQQTSYAGSATEAVPIGEEVYQAALGSFNVETLTTTLLSGANFSTVIHESGHFYLKMLQDLGGRSDAPAQVKEDYLKTMNWFGITPNAWEAMTLDQQRPYHEQWAESFERWNLEGRAPTLALQPIFSRFRAWLLSVYKSMDAFLKANPAAGKLNDEVRSIFSRLMATEEAIRTTEEARGYQPLFTNAEEAGVSQAAFDDYLAIGKQATLDGVDALQARSMRDMKWLSNARTKVLKELQSSANAERKAIAEEVTAEVMAEPVNQARTFLRTGETTAPNGDLIKLTKGYKLNTEALNTLYPKGALDTPDLSGLRGMTSAEGLDPDVVAAMFGFDSGDALVRTLLDSEAAEDKINGVTDQRMLEEHGDLIDERSIQRAADEAVHNEARAKFMATGLKMLTNSPITPTQMSKAAKQAADSAIANKRVRDLKPKQYLAAESKSSKRVMALLPKDPAGAAEAQRAALLNNRLAASAQDALTEVEKALKYLAKFNKEGTRKNIDIEYIEQIDALLEPFDLRKGLSLSTIDANTSLADWVAMQEAMGFEPTIDPEALAASRQKSYKNMTMDEVRALLDSIKQIEHMGRMKKKLLTAQDKAEFAAVVAEARASMLLNAGEAKKQHATPNDMVGKVAQWGRQMAASHRKFSSLMKQLDGGKHDGYMFNLLVKSGTVAANNETEMLAKAADDMGVLFEPVWKGMQDSYLPGNIHAIRKLVPGTRHSMTHEERVMFVMNYGNEGNRQRLMDGGNAESPVYTQADAQAIIDSLTQKELEFVQATWDYIATFKPQIEAQERALTGKTPEWVEASPFDTKYGTMRGGYYPAKYDVNLSTPAATKEAMTDLRMGMKGAFGAASARNGYAKARAEEVKGRPILLSYSTLATHVNEVVHRLAWQEWLIDAGRLTRALDKDYRAYLGVEGLQEIQKLLKDIAEGQSGPKNAVERMLAHARKGSTVVGLGWKLSTALLQPIGLSNSWGQLGTRAMTAGLMRYLTSPVASAEWVESHSLFMKNRARTREMGINEIVNTVRAGKKVTAFQSSFFYLIGKLQRTVDIPTYLAGYEKSLAEQGYENAPNEEVRARMEKQAHAVAEQSVKDTQGAGELFDQSGVQRGGELVKLFANFYSYMNTVYNQNVNNFRGTDFRSPKEVGEFIAQLLLINIVPAVLSVALKNMLKGTCEWDDKECLVTRYTGEQVGYILGQMIGLRELASVSDIVTGGKTYGYTGPAGARLVPETIKLVQQLEQGDADVPLFKAANNVAGTLLHYPAGQINNTVAGAIAIRDGEVEGWQIPMALISGPQN